MTRLFTQPTQATENTDPIDRMVNIMRMSGVPQYAQPQDWEVCLCALVLALDPKCRTYQLMEALPHETEPYSAIDVMNAVAHLGYFSRQIKGDMQSLDERLYPCLYVSPDGKPEILIERFNEQTKIFRDGSVVYLRNDQLSVETGTVYLFEHYDETRTPMSKFMREGTNFSWFRALFGRFRGTLLQILSAGFILNLISLITPLFVMLVYNRVIATGALDILPMIMTGMVMAIGFEFILRSIRSHGLSWISARMDNIVGNQIFAHLIGLAPELVERASVSSQIARIRTFESIRDFFCGSVFLSVIEMPFVILAIIAIYAIAGPLVLVPLVMCLLYAALFHTIYKRVRTNIRVAAKAGSAKQQFTIESFEKIRAIRAYGLTSLWENKFRDLSGKETMAQFRLSWLWMMGETIAHAITILAAVATIGFGAHMIWMGTLGTGALVATMILVWRILTPFYSLCTVIPRLEQLRNSILQVNKLMDIETEGQQARFNSRLGRIKGEIRFNNVSMRYNNEGDTIFSGLTFTVRQGDLVAITGENGAGKSTVLKLIKGLYKPRSGSVMIDGFDIRQLDAPDLRRQIAYVPQHMDFFDGSIVDNMRLANPLATMNEIESALELSTAHEEIMKLPDRYNTRVSRYDADRLPANLALKISLARLYLHNAPILLIDEIPNSILSGPSGKNLQEYLAQIKGKRTCMIVTYRDDIMKTADNILLMRENHAPLFGESRKIITSMMEAA